MTFVHDIYELMFYIVTHFRAYLVSEIQEKVSNVGENLNIISLFLSINSRKKRFLT